MIVICALVTHTPPGQQQAPNPTLLDKRNVETLYRSPMGTACRKTRLWRCGNGRLEKANAVL
jgi:hypothetical protein